MNVTFYLRKTPTIDLWNLQFKTKAPVIYMKNKGQTFICYL